jgi:predicted metal-dependent peptidase
MHEKLAAARILLVRRHPYLAVAAWAVVPVESAAVPTMAVDRHWRLYWNRSFVEAVPVEELAAVLYHELLHLLRAHAERLEQLPYPHAAKNIAADLEVNDDIRLEGWRLPEGALFPHQFGLPAGKTAEEYLAALGNSATDADQSAASAGEGQADPSGSGGDTSAASSPEPQERGSAPESSSGDGDGSTPSPSSEGTAAGDSGDGPAKPTEHPGGGSSGAGPAAPGDPVGDAGRVAGSSAGTPPQPRFGGGSGSTGHRQPWELDDSADTPAVSDLEAERIRRQVAAEIAEAVKGVGSVPDHLARWAEQKLRPKKNWRRELRSAVRAAVAQVAGQADYSYSRRSRRQEAVRGAILPGMVEPRPQVAVVVDTSGSMSDTEVATALAEVEGIARQLGIEVAVIACDAAAHLVSRAARTARGLRGRLVGGGGTDMGVGIEAALRLRPQPDVVVVLTDGHTPWPAQRPPVRVVVGLVGQQHASQAPSWARVVEIGE